MSVREIVEHFMRKNNNDREAAAKSFASYRGWRGHDFTPEQNAKMVQVKNIFDRMNRKG